LGEGVVCSGGGTNGGKMGRKMIILNEKI